MLYPKLNGVFKRDDNGKFTDEFAQPEFEDLLDVPWRGSEKVDGTNIRIYIDEHNISIRGRTDRASIPPELSDYIGRLDLFPYAGLELFGEGYGGKIQSGAGYGNESKFILFDAATESRRFLTLEEQSIIKLQRVHQYEPQTLRKWINDFTKHKFSKSYLRDGDAEGVVLIPVQNYLDKYGHRIATKLKVKDFQ